MDAAKTSLMKRPQAEYQEGMARETMLQQAVTQFPPWVTKVYGTLKILSYMWQDHQLDITEAVRLQDDSAVGQTGMLHLTLFVLNAILLIQFLNNLASGKKASGLTVFGCFQALVFLCCGLAIYSIGAIGKALPIPGNRLPGAASFLRSSPRLSA